MWWYSSSHRLWKAAVVANEGGITPGAVGLVNKIIHN